MIEFAWSTVSVTPRLVNEPLPVAKLISPGVRPRLTNTPPLAPTAPGWMCEAVNVVPAGNPVTFTVASMVAAVMLPAASLVRLNVRLEVPEPPASDPVTGGTSLAGSNVALNVDDAAGEGVGVVGVSLLPQPAATEARMSNPERYVKGFMS